MGRLRGTGIIALWCCVSGVQADDPVLMRIGEREILRSEFEYAYNKNGMQNSLSPEEFLNVFVRLKRQAMEAESHLSDRFPLLPKEEPELREVPQETDESVTRLAHMVIYLPQHSTGETIRRAQERMDSIYRAACAERNFTAWIHRYKERQPGMPYGEEISLPAHHAMEAIERQVRSLQPGELSRPFITPAGIHLIQLLEREEPSKHAISETQRARLARTEMREAALRETLQKTEQPIEENELEAYFREHKEHYRWELPHYRGIILYCRDKASAKEVRKLLKRLPEEEWMRVLSLHNERNPDKPVKGEYGMFRLGSHPAVDRVVFGQGTFTAPSEFPCVTAMGKRMNKWPESYQDVYEKVRSDCLADRSAAEERQLERLYKVEINQEVLKTVNNHGSKE